MRPLVAHCHFGLGKVHRRQNNREQRDQHLGTAVTLYRAMGMNYWLENARKEVG
jgi:hypothetical protein